MLARLKEMFRSKPGRGSRVNLERRFTILAETGQGSMSRVYRAVDNGDGPDGLPEGPDPREEPGRRGTRGPGAQRPDEGEIASKIIHPHVVRTLRVRASRPRASTSSSWSSSRASEPPVHPRDPGRCRPRREARVAGPGGRGAGGGPRRRASSTTTSARKNFLVDRDEPGQAHRLRPGRPQHAGLPPARQPDRHAQYMAPELIRRETIDERIDIFAFGAMAFEFLTDRLPYDATNSMASMLQRINSEPLDPARANPNLPDRASRPPPQADRPPEGRPLAQDCLPWPTPCREPSRHRPGPLTGWIAGGVRSEVILTTIRGFGPRRGRSGLRFR